VNALGQRSNVAQTGTAFAAARSTAWAYDPLGQVTRADSTIPGLDRAYAFDMIGNRLRAATGSIDPNDPAAATYTPNALNQYSQITNNSITNNPAFDADGNMTSGALPANVNANSTLVWDGENRLIQATVGTTGSVVRYSYDSQSRRIAETVGTTTKLTIYDGWNPIAEYWRAGLQPASLAKSFTWGIDLSGTLQGAGGVGGLLMTSLITNNSITSNYFPTYDGNGNVSEYLNESGEVSAHYEYDPFGKTTVATGPKANDFAHRFSTKPLDLTTGLYYYGYRFYDPNSGRWPSRDPIEERGGVNLYGFVGNNGVGKWDYLGMLGCDGCDGKSKGSTTLTKHYSYDCMDGKTDKEFLDDLKVSGAIITVLLAANDVPTPGGNPYGTAPATGGVGSSAPAVTTGLNAIHEYWWTLRQAKIRNNKGYNKCVKYECKECKCCAIFSKSWTVTATGVAEGKTVAAARAAADKACP